MVDLFFDFVGQLGPAKLWTLDAAGAERLDN